MSQPQPPRHTARPGGPGGHASARAVAMAAASCRSRQGATRPSRARRTTTNGIGVLLAAAQRAGTVRADAGRDEVVALVVAACQGALHAGWDADLRRRALGLLFDGLRPRP
ncbi:MULTISPECIES: hypothetical protein [Actinomadura]|uniref:Transcriptional regulator SbtR-like C-terminal domain-containing protein n=1 Tax=Actinomadura yumaensis TaxID=111807 RepID=A0ABW2CXT9_9ACTN|nr:hypothetical protein [Actinomadura sp. J1-007]MWK39116.1 hypothetical protein [Actinomadura sp. J1-007]